MKKTALFLIMIFVSGCSKADIPRDEPEKNENESVIVSTGRLKGSLIGENYDFFIGADITEDINIDGIEGFEEKFSSHDLYADEVSIDEGEKAASFILECYSKNKIPYLIIKNRDGISDDDFRKYAEDFAETVGRYHVRVIAEVLENSYYYDEDGKKYLYLSELIKKNNDLAETVWSVKSDDIILVGSMLPEENVDFICVNGYFSSKDGAERMFSEIRDHLNTDKKLIFRFGAASYRGDDCVYTPDEAEDTIEFVYDTVKKDEWAEGVIYMDKNRRLSDRVIYTDYSLTTDGQLSEGYKEIIAAAKEYRENGMAETNGAASENIENINEDTVDMNIILGEDLNINENKEEQPDDK